MKEKVVPIPFLGREVSGWLYRTTRWVNEHPYKAAGIVIACVGGTLVYEAQVTHKDTVVSPNVRNHLEYSLKKKSLWDRWFHRQQSLETKMAAAGVAPTDGAPANTADEREDAQVASAVRIEDAQRLLDVETDPLKRAELQKIIDQENELMSGVSNTTMLVRSGQLTVREPHWEIRNNERNWSILSRDQQQQKDHYWYRLDRSKEDDYARNSYSKP